MDKPPKTGMVTAAAGGTGQFAVQLMKHAGIETVIGTCSSQKKVICLYAQMKLDSFSLLKIRILVQCAHPLQFQLVCARNAERKHEKVKRPWNYSYFGHLMWFPLMQVSAWTAGCV